MMFDNPFQCFQFLETMQLKDYKLNIAATGGGAYKFESEIKKLNENKDFLQINQFQAIVKGLELMVKKQNPLKVSSFHKEKQQISRKQSSEKLDQKSFPMLLVNIGSGASMNVINIDQKQKKLSSTYVGGTSLAGGFFMGLNKIVNGEDKFQQIQAKINQDEKYQPFKIEKLAKEKGSSEKNIFSLVFGNLCQLALLQTQITKISNIIFFGSIISKNYQFLLNCFQDSFKKDLIDDVSTKTIYMSSENNGMVGAISSAIEAYNNK